MDRYTAAYLHIIHEDIADIQNSYKRDFQSSDCEKLNFINFNFGEEFKQQMCDWIYDYLKNGQYYADITFNITQDLFFVINNEYGLRDKENDFQIHMCRMEYTYGKQEWTVIKQFDEFNKNAVPQAVDTICAWLNSKKHLVE